MKTRNIENCIKQERLYSNDKLMRALTEDYFACYFKTESASLISFARDTSAN